MYGISEKFNLGFDLYLRGVNFTGSQGSPFEVFSNPSRTSFSKFGPRVRLVPFKKIGRLSLNSTFLIPTAPNLEGVSDGGPWLDWDAYTWLNQLFFDRNLSTKVQLFTAAEFFLHIPRNSFSQSVQFITPVKTFLSYFPNTKLTVYGMVEFGPQWSNNAEIISSFYSQVGIGGKYQLFPSFELEVLYSNFPFGKNQGAGTTYNFGVRFLR